MINNQRNEGNNKEAASDKNRISPPSISLPKGGGAIRGIGEKFAANPVTGTGSMSIPIATSPGRSGFGPQLSLSYDSGAGNGAFGFGWSLLLPSITRKTDKGLPKYQDADESDVFILSGAEDLVPVLVEVGGQWGREIVPSRTVNGNVYSIQRYRPRIEGLFARIERWTNQSDAKDVFWRSISKDNITTFYGKTAESRIADPSDPTHIFSWLICESYEDKGNAILYEYKEENYKSIDQTQVNERNRGADSRKANRYLKRVWYGNTKSHLDSAFASRDEWKQATKWLFEVVFDYDERYYVQLSPRPDGFFVQAAERSPTDAQWPVRPDPFSVYRAGFEVRTYRRCHRVLMFHRFAELGPEPYLVRSTEFDYADLDYSKSVTIENELAHKGSTRIASFIRSITQSGYVQDKNQPIVERDGSKYVTYIKRSLPPLDFDYSQATINEEIQVVDTENLQNLPIGADGMQYQWLDLDGEGVSGILSEQEDGWYYKRNLSPITFHHENGIPKSAVKFEPLVEVSSHPSIVEGGGERHQFLDLAGDGQLDLVQLERPIAGFFERTSDERWENFIPFSSTPNLFWGDANLKFVDLTGDGHADILITEDDALVWHSALEEEGFGEAIRIHKPRDEEEGPAVVFADATQAVFLADLSGDGLTDIVRIRNGEVCYWPNLGYGRFGKKVTMDQSPWFDTPDQFDQRRIRLADIDGSGVTDIVYLARDGVRLYFNQSGNRWSDPHTLQQFPHIDNLSSVQATDLLGNGTACLVWTSPLPGYARQPMRYIDLMGGQKPHLLVSTKNNLGAETKVQYAPSTKFYLADKSAGKPWITRLPFPVHCVEKMIVTDKWRNTTFATTYSYHHGYYDGIEREFRGFGRVEQIDSEDYGTFEAGNTASPYITNDKALYQPPVKTVTWFHTGAFLDREWILSYFEEEYFPKWFEDLKPTETNVLGIFQENTLPEPDLDAQDLTTEEWREALRACKGMPLRQEVYELDVQVIKTNEHRAVKLFTTAYHNCRIRRIQPREDNKHSVFLVTESEAITYHYELDLPSTSRDITPDPRIAHTLNLNVDEYGNVIQSVAVVYPRLGRHVDGTLPPGTEKLISDVQTEPHMAYTENRFTNDVKEDDNYRLRVPCEVLTYELTGIGPEDKDDRVTTDPRDNRYFAIDELRGYRLSSHHQNPNPRLVEVEKKDYHELPNGATPQKRIVEHVRTLFFKDDLTGPLDFRKLGRLGLPYETYKLALTKNLLDAVFGTKLDDVAGASTVRDSLNASNISGYLSGTLLDGRFRPEPTTGEYWVCSGVAGFNADAPQHFYVPERYTDPFGNTTTLNYDPRDLYVQSSTDPVGNTITVTVLDFRVLAPSEIKDFNDNYGLVAFDALGMPVASAVMGKNRTESGDKLTILRADLTVNEVDTFLTAGYDVTIPRGWLANATTRYVYDLGEKLENGKITYGQRPAGACGILREKHVSQLKGGENRIQVSVVYFDGLGAVLVKKAQAEPASGDTKLRWIASGKTLLNNKGKPVKQYEPYFSQTELRFDPTEAASDTGVTPVMYYDGPGRLIRSELPDGSFSKVKLTPWHVVTYDPNDTAFDSDPAKLSDWYKRRKDPTHPRFTDFNSAQNARATELVEMHANTPASTFLDSLGREVISVPHNKFKDSQGALHDEKYVTFTKLDAEGKPLWIRDARGNLVMQYITPPVPNNQVADPQTGFVPCYDIAGNLLFQHSMDAGDRWMLNDAAGNPMYAWDSRGHMIETGYDQLRRPVEIFVSGGDDIPVGQRVLAEKTIYGESKGSAKNHRGTIFQHFDGAGVVTNIEYDFKGNLKETSRKLVKEYKKQIDWNQPPADDETFTTTTEFDALNRPILITTPHNANIIASEIRPIYNEANLLNEVRVKVRGAAETAYVKNINYNAKGQREKIEYGNGASTSYEYDDDTFRLNHLRTTRQSDGALLQDLFYTYDPLGNITHIRDDAQQKIYFNNTVVPPENVYTYDAIYRLLEASGREHIGQTANNRPEHRPELKPHYDFNDSTRMGLAHPHDGQTMRQYSELYEYDAVGNFRSMTHKLGTLPKPGQTLWVRRYDYEPDSNRLRGTNIPGDPDVGPLPVRYEYDAHGNMTKMPHLTLMRWNFKDQLRATSLQVTNTGTPETTYYVYESGGQRVRKVTEAQNGAPRNERLYLGGFEIYREYNGGAVNLARETLHIMDDKHRIALVETKTKDISVPAYTLPETLRRYQNGNHLGSASLELDDKAQVISYEEFTPYGGTSYQGGRSQTETSKRYRYTGKERDEESGLYYHGARYYMPWIERWVSCDPQVPYEDINTYSYCFNNPVRYRDPLGRAAEPKNADEIRRITLLMEEYAKKGPTIGLGPIIIPPEDNTPVLGLLPDGRGMVAPRSLFEKTKAYMERQLYWERQMRTGQNIAGGLGGTLGYAIAGDTGSDIGAIVDAGLFLRTPHPLNSQPVVNAPSKATKSSAPRSDPKPNPSSEKANKSKSAGALPSFQPEQPPLVAPFAPKGSPRANKLEQRIAEVRKFYRLSPSDTTEVGLVLLPGFKKPAEVKSGHEGGPWVGTQLGSVPRGKGSAYSSGAPSESNIGTHVEGHAIQGMWATGSKQGILIVGSEPCGVCSPNISSALPPDAQLIIIHPDKAHPGDWTTTYYRSNR